MNYSLNVREIPRVCHIGEKVYVVSKRSGTQFQEKCPICDDEKHITYRDHVFDCPYCVGTGYRTKDIQRNSIFTSKFVVEEYIVNEVLIEGPDTKSAYEAKNRDKVLSLPRIKTVSAFTRRNSGYNSVETIRVPDGRFLDPDDDTVLNAMETRNCVFTTRQKAERAAKLLKEKDRQALAEFNKKYGCSYEYPEK